MSAARGTPVIDIHGAKLTPELIAYRCEVDAPNARAMAYAPELAEALADLMAWAKSVEGQSVSRGITSTPDSVFTAAREAIAKAEGGAK